MEFLPTNLSTCLERYGVLPDEISYSVLHGVALGLSYLHGQTPPIIHRDLSANNVLLSYGMTAKISDLGVARLLNLTPLEASRMTMTPGTPAYMPPEVMIANPHYDTSVDEFSYGIMIIHVFTGEWPLPKVGQIRVDPSNPDILIPVSEAERREEYIRKIGQNHPLINLIMRCLNNSPRHRARAVEIAQLMSDLVLQFPPSFENKIEMLRRINDDERENRTLQQDIVKNVSTIAEKQEEIEKVREQCRQECENTKQRFELAYSILLQQIEGLKVQNETMAQELRTKEATLEKKEAINVCLNDQLTKSRDFLTSKLQPLQVKLSYRPCAEAPVETNSGQSTVINGKVYYGGGNCDADYDEYNVYCYDSSQNTWVTFPALSVRYFGLGQVNGELVTVGGWKSGKELVTNDVYVFDNCTQNWKQSLPSMPTERHSAAVLSHPSCLVVAGGWLASCRCTDIVEIYNINLSQWSTTHNLPHACSELTATVVDNKAYLMGGWNDEISLNTVYTASIETLITNAVAVDEPNNESSNAADVHSWKMLARTAEYDPSTVAISGIVLAVGGRVSPHTSEVDPTKTIHSYSSSMDSWLHIGDLPSPLECATVSSLSPIDLIVIGGMDENNQRMSTVHQITLQITTS